MEDPIGPSLLEHRRALAQSALDAAATPRERFAAAYRIERLRWVKGTEPERIVRESCRRLHYQSPWAVPVDRDRSWRGRELVQARRAVNQRDAHWREWLRVSVASAQMPHPANRDRARECPALPIIRRHMGKAA